MPKSISLTKRAYLAGFLDGDGSVYVRLKPNKTYRFGYQVALYIVLFQSQKEQSLFEKVCSMINLGHMRKRNDGISEYIIQRIDAIKIFIPMVMPYVILKRRQLNLLSKIIKERETISTKNDFLKLMAMIDQFRDLNYSKRRIKRTLTP